MPLDTSTTYPLTRLRLDGRRWNELRLLQAQISTNPASSGSSFLSMGNTSIMCSVHGPAEGRRGEASGAAGSANAVVDVEVNIAGFASVDRKRRAGGSDRYATVTLGTAVAEVTSICRAPRINPTAAVLTSALPSTDNPRALRQSFALRSNRTYTHIFTRTVRLASTSRFSLRTALSSRQQSMPAHWPWWMQEFPCPVYSAAAQQA